MVAQERQDDWGHGRDPLRMRVVHPPPLATAPTLRLTASFIAWVQARHAYAWIPHRHHGYEAILVARGVYRCRIDGSEVRAGAGDAVLVAPGELHEDLLAAGVRYAGIAFTVEGMRRGRPFAVLAAGVPPQARVVPLGVRAVVQAVEGLIASTTARDIAGGKLLEARMAALFWSIVHLLPPSAVTTVFRRDATHAEFLSRLQRSFDAHVAQPTSVAAIARDCGVSATTLGVRCRALLGASPAAAFRAHRLEQAHALLEHAQLPVGAVAEQLGFADPFHFSRLFKRHYGYPPSRLLMTVEPGR